MRKDLKRKKIKSIAIKTFPPKKITQKEDKYLNIKNKQIIITRNKLNNNITKNKAEIKIINNIQNTKNSELYKFTKEKKYDDFELNKLEYNEAIKLDRRTFLEIYLSILKREQSIIFTFFIRNDHNIIYIKYPSFIFFICTNMVLNVFFFSEEAIHKIFLDYGKYNIIQQIPQIIYSTIVSQLIQVFICYLSLIDKHYYQIKNLKIKSKKEISKIIKCVKIKIYFFFIFTGIMYFFYWYIITCFCEVYKNTQIAFIKDSLISFAL